jgi:hypothetical protein
MPIRLNLLAEAQAVEEQRRRDPVKRAIWIAALLIALMLVWASSLQLKAIIANQSLGKVAAQMQARTNDFKKVIDAQRKIADINFRLASLHALATNRFLNGNLLDALQHTVVDDIQLSLLRVEQSYLLVEGTKPKTNSNNTVVPGKPATATERIVLTFDGSDASPSPGDEVTRFKDLLANHPYFLASLGRTNQVTLKSLSAPTIHPDSGRAMVLFSLEIALPPRTR